MDDAIAQANKFKAYLRKKVGADDTDKRTCYELIAAAGSDTRYEKELHMACQIVDAFLAAAP